MTRLLLWLQCGIGGVGMAIASNNLDLFVASAIIAAAAALLLALSPDDEEIL
jgi:hypothetical protein